MRAAWLWFCMAIAARASALAQSSLPNPALTPGAINPAVTQDNIGETICVRGWTRTVRPPREYTEQLKRDQIRQYGYQTNQLRDFEEDHLIPIGLGGAPANPRNLWPEPRWRAGGWTADMKDELEARLHAWSASGASTSMPAAATLRETGMRPTSGRSGAVTPRQMGNNRSPRDAVPAVFWHSYDHPERRPDPDPATALAATVAAFPSWHFRTVCRGCGRAAHVSQVGLLLDGWAERRVSEVVRSLRCGSCGGRPATVELVSRFDAQTGGGPIRRVRLR